jgi:hypothetical protein
MPHTTRKLTVAVTHEEKQKGFAAAARTAWTQTAAHAVVV